MYEKLKELSIREIIGYTIGSEDAANKYYLDLAKKVNELTAVRFENLARDEAAHKKVLLSLHKELFGDENWVMPEGLPPFESSMKVETVENLITALGNAMLNEYNAYKVYKFLANHKKEHRALFEYLAVMEHGHYESLKMEKELYEDKTIVDAHIKALSAYNWTKFM